MLPVDDPCRLVRVGQEQRSQDNVAGLTCARFEPAPASEIDYDTGWKHAAAIDNLMPVQVSLHCDDNLFARVQVFNHRARLPENFDFRTGAGLGTGLRLVKSLIPSGTTRLSIEENPNGVVAKLELRKTSTGKMI